MDIILHVVHVLSALALIGLILIQQGKGADAGVSFGGGASQTVFGSGGAGSFLTRSTAILATVFMLTSLALAWDARQKANDMGTLLPALERIQQEESQVPAVDTGVPVLPNGEAGSAADEEIIPVLPEESNQ